MNRVIPITQRQEAEEAEQRHLAHQADARNAVTAAWQHARPDAVWRI